MEFLYGQTSGQNQSNPIFSLLPLILIFVVFYFLLVLPQQKRQKQHQKLLNSLKKGDRVITSSGIYGTIANVKDNIINLVIADGVKVDIDKNHIVSRIGSVEEGK
uniref:Preprotein translocase subunit YajC n=1 Tax=candidate division WOR-3 bacterium TaxID=2052148 RepID=A0A7V0Z3E4_UNCW3